MEEKNISKEEEKYNKAKKRVAEIKGFYGHLFSYIGVNITLFVINAVSSFGAWWFYWVTIFWGIGIFWHAMGVFVFDRKMSSSWENRKIKKIMKEMDEEEK